MATVLRFDPYRNKAYLSILESLLAEHHPTTETARQLVVEYAQAWWNLQRAQATETRVMNRYGAMECFTGNPGRRAFQIVQSEINRCEKAWYAAADRLKAVRSQS